MYLDTRTFTHKLVNLMKVLGWNTLLLDKTQIRIHDINV